MKQCCDCKIDKELNAFSKDVNNRDGLQYRCRECVSKRRKYVSNVSTHNQRAILLSEWFRYDPKLGNFFWVKKPSQSVEIGDLAGGTCNGYVVLKVRNTQIKGHQAAWYFVHGIYPNKPIDHINGVRDDNRIENLRLVTFRQNSQNQLVHRNGKLPGATWHKVVKKWASRWVYCGKFFNLGYYHTEQEAHKMYLAFDAEWNSGFGGG